jgi:hypothetical protein
MHRAGAQPRRRALHSAIACRPSSDISIQTTWRPKRNNAVEEMLFQRELIDAMHAAFIKVCARLRLRPGSSESDLVALSIVDLAKNGVHDPKTLASLALLGMNTPKD